MPPAALSGQAAECNQPRAVISAGGVPSRGTTGRDGWSAHRFQVWPVPAVTLEAGRVRDAGRSSRAVEPWGPGSQGPRPQSHGAAGLRSLPCFHPGQVAGRFPEVLGLGGFGVAPGPAATVVPSTAGRPYHAVQGPCSGASRRARHRESRPQRGAHQRPRASLEEVKAQDQRGPAPHSTVEVVGPPQPGRSCSQGYGRTGRAGLLLLR